MTSARLYLRYLNASIRSQMQYRASFLMYAAGNFLATGIEFLGIWALFTRFGAFAGWSLSEVALIYGMIDVAFAIAEAGVRGFDVFPRLVQSGEFDRYLLRPRSLVLQVTAYEFQLMRIGRLSQGLLILLWAAAVAGVTWTPVNLAILLAGIAAGTCVFSGLFILGATLSFWTIQSLELVNITTYGGVYTAQYPISIYKPWLRWLLMTFIPLAVCNYLPLHAILGRYEPMGTTTLMQSLSPIVGIVFLLVCLRLWHLGVRHYQSTGS
jgi:ABC-2 type transport system permease protein